MTSLSLRVIKYNIFKKHLKKIILKGFNVNENRKRGCVTIVRTPHVRTAGRQCIHILHSIQPTCRSSSRSDTTTPDTFYPSNFLFSYFRLLRVYLRRHHRVWRGSQRVVILFERCSVDRLSSVHQRGLPALRRSDREPFEGSVHGLIHRTDWTRALSRFLVR